MKRDNQTLSVAGRGCNRKRGFCTVAGVLNRLHLVKLNRASTAKLDNCTGFLPYKTA